MEWGRALMGAACRTTTRCDKPHPARRFHGGQNTPGNADVPVGDSLWAGFRPAHS